MDKDLCLDLDLRPDNVGLDCLVWTKTDLDLLADDLDLDSKKETFPTALTILQKSCFNHK